MFVSVILFISLFSTSFTVQSRSTKNQSIVIIGAGAAGLSAASKLLENGYINVIILEAEDRIGGRIRSVYFGNNYIDLGARWCHGQEKNIVYSTVKDLHLLKKSIGPKHCFYSTQIKLDDKFAEELIQIMDEVYMTDAEYPPEFHTYGDYCTYQFNKIVKEKFGSDNHKFKIAKDALDFFELGVLSDEGSSSWYDSTAQSDYRECTGYQLLNWKGRGYKTFLEILLKKYPDNSKQSEVEKKIVFNKEVSKIMWDSDKKSQGVLINCSDNTQFKADHVIVTPSVGVLKERIDSMFSPSLPLQKRRAIEIMGFGPVMKIAVYYSEKWWNDEYVQFNFIWNSEEREKSILEFPEGPHHNNRSWVTYIPFMLSADNNTNVFMYWLTGPLVSEVEQLSDELILKGIIYVSKKFLGGTYNVTNPDKIMRSNWYSNPHFRGSYSFQTVEAKRGKNATNAQEDLAEPIKNVDGRPFVHFAGEGTHSMYYSNVHGAVESGFREADLIINYYKNDNYN